VDGSVRDLLPRVEEADLPRQQEDATDGGKVTDRSAEVDEASVP
jgi:hypothetical protein